MNHMQNQIKVKSTYSYNDLFQYLGTLWIVLMKFLAGVMVWTSLVLSIALLTASCVYCTLQYMNISNQTLRLVNSVSVDPCYSQDKSVDEVDSFCSFEIIYRDIFQ